MESLPFVSYFWIIAFSVVLLASIIQGMTGFGGGLLIGPALTLFLDPKLVVIIIMFTGVGNLLFVVYHARRHITVERALPLIIPGILGIPVGTYILHRVASSITSVAIASVSIIFSIILLLGYHMPIKREAMASLGFGFTSGVMCAGVGMGGPPIILFLSNQGWTKEMFRGTVAIHFLLTGSLTIILYVITGMATTPRIMTAISLLPPAIIGFFIGNLIFQRVSSTIFLKSSLSLILFAGLTSLFIHLFEIL
ncbi:MAG: sulfite exporter TauE/SafE family protein [Deltaproteobacteria bacterium]|nr:sulfite exporter TauE/SafE family protein [Deltaproteobacteria bacterium]